MRRNEIEFVEKNLNLFCCPKCGGGLNFNAREFDCLDCRQKYRVLDDIPSLFWPNEWGPSKGDVTELVKNFYEENPFPNYDDLDNVSSLINKAKRALLTKLLDDQVPFGARILECGCGTGQLTNFLSVANRTVIGTDVCLNSLRMAQKFKERNGLDRAHFYQMNLFRPCFKAQSFDLVISNGVLHHTSDPFLAFKTIASLVKPNRYILVGLYHKYGRIMTDIRRTMFRLTRDRLKFLDNRAVSASIGPAKRDVWYADQYKHPIESKHTISEVLRWLSETGFTFIHSIPKTTLFEPDSESDRLFDPDRVGNRLERFIVNTGMVFEGHREGGFFIVIAKKSRS
jgi:SAM-dependent methyltransferase